jgi:trans-aconitate methyltransferase
VRPGRLLDIASGSGYGTALLADRHPAVQCTGVDIDSDAVAFASSAYGRPNVTFRQADAMTFSDEQGFDTIVSLETIEHLDVPQVFVDRLVAMLRPGGRIIASVPSTPSIDGNPYHRSDFTERSFVAMFERHGLNRVSWFRLVQPFSSTPSYTRQDASKARILRRLVRHYARHPDSLLRRLVATVRYGFENRYITAVWERSTSEVSP